MSSTPRQAYASDSEESEPSELTQLIGHRSTSKCCTPLADCFRGLFPRDLGQRVKESRSNHIPQANVPSPTGGSYRRGLGDSNATTLPPRQYSPSVILSDTHGDNIDGSNNSKRKRLPDSSAIPRQYSSPVVFPEAHDFSIRDTNIMNVGRDVHLTNYGGIQDLDVLKESVSFGALHDSSVQDPERKCHPGTREAVIRQICSWADNPDTADRILWLHGPAGVGKSAIAQTLAYSYDPNTIAATFFFFRSDASRNDGNRLFPTLAWQLAASVQGFRDQLAHSLRTNPDIARKAIEIQFEMLIAQPLKLAVAASRKQIPSVIVIIDGVDECLDEKLQRRFLKIIGNAVTDSFFPLRFFISSRPEAHIEESLNPFKDVALSLDLAKIEALQDIETYLRSEFSRIATEQGIDPKSWPGDNTIQDFVSRSSGQFIYASTIVRFIGDEDNSAHLQLDIILKLKPAGDVSPFSTLDALYLEILYRQLDQKFLLDFLAVMIARNIIISEDRRIRNLFEDDALLLNIDNSGLYRKLRRMRSLLKFDPYIAVHHRSFLEFLEGPSRAHHYHISPQAAQRRYIEFIVAVLVQRATEDLDHHGKTHFAPRFNGITRRYPLSIKLSLPDLEMALQPLSNLQDRLLSLPMLESDSPWKRQSCNECKTFSIIYELLLHLAFMRGASITQVLVPAALQTHNVHYHIPTEPVGSGKIDSIIGGGDISSCSWDKKNLSENDLDGFLSLWPACIKSMSSITEEALQLAPVILSCNPADIASRIRTMSDAKTLLDLIIHVVDHPKYLLNCGITIPTHNITLLALEIHARVPIFPSALFVGEKQGIKRNWTDGRSMKAIYGNRRLIDLCQRSLVWRTVSHENIVPFYGLQGNADDCAFLSPENVTLHEWRQQDPTNVSVLARILEVARAIRHLHSLGIVLGYLQIDTSLDQHYIYIDADGHAQIEGEGLSLEYMKETRGKGPFLEDDILDFGVLFYEVYFNKSGRRPTEHPVERPDNPIIRDDAWGLIQQCLSEDSERRPTIYQVVGEMESWKEVG